jgi:AcrR family transcriptional regulator
MSTRGRPRDHAVDEAILQAATELLIERGFTRMNVEDVINRAGTSRPAFYRRYGQLADVLPAVLARRFGEILDIDTGTWRQDLLAFLQQLQAVFTDPLIQRRAAGFLSVTSREPEHGTDILNQFIRPRRELLATLVYRARSRGELNGEVDQEWVFDLTVGPYLARLLVPGAQPIDTRFTHRVVGTILSATASTSTS